MQHSVPFMVIQTGGTFGNLMHKYYGESHGKEWQNVVLNTGKSLIATGGALAESIPIISEPTTVLGALSGNREYQKKLAWQVENMWKPALYHEYFEKK